MSNIPVGLRVHLTHATLQAIADEVGADILHIKGPAVDPSLLPTRPARAPRSPEDTEPVPRMSTDADIIVRPAHVPALMAGLDAHGWTIVTHFSTGSAFGHAATMWHRMLGYVDVHRHFPGVTLSAAEAFTNYWLNHEVSQLAHVPCRVPSVPMQRLLLILHGAREGGLGNADVDRLWTRASDIERAEARDLARRLGADVAFAAATGTLEDHQDSPLYPLWRAFEHGSPEDRLAEWRGRFAAAQGPGAKAAVVLRAMLVNTDHLRMRLGRPPRPSEVITAYADRVRRAFAALKDRRR